MAGNINPATGTFTTAGMLLGNEIYPSAVQNSLCHNTGYLLFQPRVISSSGEVWDVAGAAGTRYNAAYLTAGTYRMQAAVYWSIDPGSFGTATVKIAGTTILVTTEGTAEGIASAGTLDHIVSADAWQTVTVAANGTDTAIIRAWAVHARQFGV
jgi:hypothetical protein